MLPLTPDWQDGWVTDATGLSHDSRMGAFGHLLGMCGCGSAETIAVDALRLLRYQAERHAASVAEPRRSITDMLNNPDPGPPWPEGLSPDDRYTELLLHILDGRGLLEHGSIVTYGWPTDLGRQWLDTLGSEST